MRKSSFFYILLVLCFSFASSACKQKKGDGKEVDELRKALAKESVSHEECTEKNADLQERVTRLENAIKKIKEQPCEFELDPVSLEVKRVDDGGKAGTRKTGPARPASGPPLDPKKVAVKVRSATRIMKRCYEEAAKRNKELAASSRSVTLKFTLLNSGNVGKIVLTPFVGSGFDKCVKSEVKSWKFDAYGGFPKTFQQRIHLTPKG